MATLVRKDYSFLLATDTEGKPTYSDRKTTILCVFRSSATADGTSSGCMGGGNTESAVGSLPLTSDTTNMVRQVNAIAKSDIDNNVKAFSLVMLVALLFV